MNAMHLLCMTGALLLAGLLYAETSSDTTAGAAADARAGTVQHATATRAVPQTPEEALRLKAALAEDAKKTEEKAAAEAGKKEQQAREKAREAAEKAEEHRAKADAYRATGHPIAEACEHDRQAQERAAEAADKAKERIAKDEKNAAAAGAKKAAAEEVAAEQAAKQAKDESEKGVAPGLTKKNPDEMKEADKGSQQGQESRAKRRKWYKLWLSE